MKRRFMVVFYLKDYAELFWSNGRLVKNVKRWTAYKANSLTESTDFNYVRMEFKDGSFKRSIYSSKVKDQISENGRDFSFEA